MVGMYVLCGCVRENQKSMDVSQARVRVVHTAPAAISTLSAARLPSSASLKWKRLSFSHHARESCVHLQFTASTTTCAATTSLPLTPMDPPMDCYRWKMAP